MDASGNVFVIGWSENAGGSSDYYTVKYAGSNGATLWEKIYDGGFPDSPTGLALDGSGNAIVSGYSGNATGTNNDFFTIKYAAANGGVLWTRRTNGSGNGNDAAYRVAVHTNGDVAVTGGSDGPGGNADMLTERYNGATGAVMWSVRYDGPVNGLDYGDRLAFDASGNVFATGWANNGSNADWYVVKYAAATGAVLWQRTYNGPANADDYPNALRVTAAGDVVVAGNSSDGTYSDAFSAIYSGTDGTMLWSARWNGAAGKSDGATDMAVLPSGFPVIAGYSNLAAGASQLLVVAYSPPVPVVTLAATTGLTKTAVTLNGTVNPSGYATTAQFEYGLTTSYGSTASIALSPNNGTTVQSVSANLTGLTPATLYHCRLTATSSSGTSVTADATFTTLPPDVEIHLYAGANTAAPELTDGQAAAVDFGSTLQGTPVVRSFTVQNTGTDPLQWSALTLPAGYELIGGPFTAQSIAAGGTFTFQLRLPGTVLGTFAGTLALTSNDVDEATFDVPVTGRVVAPEIRVYAGPDTGAPELTDGQAAAVDFGTTILGTPVTRTFGIRNNGDSDLHVSGLTLPASYEAVGGFAPLTIPPATNYFFQVRFLAHTVHGTFGGTMNVLSDDADEGSFDFPVTAMAIYSQTLIAGAANGGAINIPDVSPANPYPTTISLAGYPASSVVQKVTVTLNGFSHTYPGDVAILLVGPDGTAVALMDNAGGGADANQASITFDDQAPSFIQSPVVSGTFRPTYNGGDSLIAPAPSAPYFSQLAAFNGRPINGNWSLFINDHVGTDSGSISGGWSLQVTYSTSVVAPPPTMVTQSATNLLHRGATLNGTANPVGIITNARLEWGSTTSYGNTTPVQAIGYGTTAVPLSAVLTGLTPNQTYHYRIVAQNGETTAYGADLTLVPPNANPVATANSYHPALPGPFALAVRTDGTADSDPDGDPVVVSSVTQGAKGAVTFTAAGVTYTPGAGYDGNDSFNYTITDGYGGTGTATVTLHNAAPSPVNDTYHRNQPGPFVLPVLTTGTADSDSDGDALTIVSVTNGLTGTVTTNGATVSYAPGILYTGNDTFTYTIADGHGLTAAGTVTLTNAGPVATPATHSPTEDVPTVIALTGTDPENDARTFSIVTLPAHGTLSGTPPLVTYTSDPDYNGPDSFTFKASDGLLESAPAVITLNVTTVNDPPVTSFDVFSVVEDQPLTVPLTKSVLKNDTDFHDGAPLENNRPLTAVVDRPPGGAASFALNANGTFTYTPKPNFHGLDAFTYRAVDSLGGQSDSETVLIAVMAENDAPVAQSQAVSTLEDVPLAIHLHGADVDTLSPFDPAEWAGLIPPSGSPAPYDNALIYTVTQAPLHGILSGTGTTRTYTPNANYHGTDTIKFTVSDGLATSPPATVTITILPDSDGDALPDMWGMAAFGGLTYDGSDDPDGDGQDNAFELIAGNDPADANSCLRMESASPDGISAGVFRLNHVRLGVVYVLESSTDLNAWDRLSENTYEVEGPGAIYDERTDAGSRRRCYCRVRVDHP